LLHGYGPAQVGLVFAAQAVTNVVGRIPIGSLADRCDRRWIVAAGLICLSVALTVLGQVVQLSQLLGCAVVMGVGMALTFTTIGAMIADQAPAIQRGLAMGMYNSCIYLGMMSGSTIMGITLKRIGYPLSFAAAGSIDLVVLVLFLPMMREKTRLRAGQDM
jgi:MFS family permease